MALDAFGGFEATRQCSFVAEVAPNIVFDTSLSYNFDFIEEFARRFGADRVVFGTDLYSHPVGQRISHLLPQILASALPDTDQAAILGGNSRACSAWPDPDRPSCSGRRVVVFWISTHRSTISARLIANIFDATNSSSGVLKHTGPSARPS